MISAIATAPGAGGVAIVRVSGEGALSLARKMFSRTGEFAPNSLYPGVIDCGQFRDFGMCVYFAAPRSFTGEETVEFHCHGGTEIARAALRQTLSLGARLAEPGEFTRRAYLNGKLSLSAVEGLGEMISAQSAAQVRAGFALYNETLTQKARSLQEMIKSCLADADADVDYPEEELSLDLQADVREKLGKALEEINALKNQYRTGKKIKSGVMVAICGRPNAGKSSLLNALVGYERAIVSDSAGTTRDLIEENLEIHGVLFRLTDAAGLREGADEVEREGVRRAERVMKSADLILYLPDGEKLQMPEDVPVITVGTKCDLFRREGCDVWVSSKTGEGIAQLKELLYERGIGRESEGIFLIEERHKEALSEAYQALLRAKTDAEAHVLTELLAEDLKSGYTALGKITGETANEAILHEIFGKFCLGK